MSIDPITDDALALGVLSGERSLATEIADIEAFGEIPIAVASHVIGDLAAVLLILPHTPGPEASYDLDIYLAQRRSPESGWEALSQGGITLGGTPGDLREEEFYTGASSELDVYVDGDYKRLRGVSGWAPSGWVVARHEGREVDRIRVLPHGLFCFATCLPEDAEVEYSNEI